jgi:hypothetical protein
MNVIEKKFEADLVRRSADDQAWNIPIPAARAAVAFVFGSSDSQYVSYKRLDNAETFEVSVLGFELKRNHRLVISRAEHLEHELSGPEYQIKVVRKVAGFIPVSKLIESSADMVPFCTEVPNVDPFC